MFCRRAWQRVAPLTRRALKRAPRNGAPVRHMASGLPGGSFNTTYFVLCGGGLTAALVYAYKTINSDTERYESRLASMGSTAKGQFEAAAPAAEPGPAEEAEITEVVRESVSGPAEEASAEPEASSEAAAAEDVSEEPANEAAETAAEASEAAEDAAPPAAAEETSAESQAAESAGTAAVGGAPPAAPEVAA